MSLQIKTNIRKAVQSYLLPAWAAQFPTWKMHPAARTPVDLATQSLPFANFRILLNKSEFMGIPASHAPLSFSGHVLIQLFTRDNAGEVDSDTMADFLIDLFTAKQVEHLTFKLPTLLTPDTALGWYKQTIQAPFRSITQQ